MYGTHRFSRRPDDGEEDEEDEEDKDDDADSAPIARSVVFKRLTVVALTGVVSYAPVSNLSANAVMTRSSNEQALF